MRKSPISITSTFLLIISFIGLILAITLTYSTTTQHEIFWQKPLVGTAFWILCILGIFAGMFPSKCSTIFHFKRLKSKKLTDEPSNFSKETRVLRGHHPSCRNFDSHIIHYGNRAFCAGCTGLISGALFSLIGAAAYFFINLPLCVDYQLILWAGFIGVTFGLLQYHLFSWGGSILHLSVNIFFVFGVLLLLVGIDSVAKSITLDLYVIALSVFWIYTRILLSRIDHRNICSSCLKEECEFYLK